MNDTSGWIKIHRSVLDHWIWKDRIKFGWWLEMLFMANWEQRKVIVGNTLVTVERGQMIASNRFLMEKWGVCTHTIRNFLRLLESDGMITQTTYPKFNIITICNYDKYQCDDIERVDPNDDPNLIPLVDPKTDPKTDPNKEYKKERIIKEKEDTIVSSKKKFSFFDELVALGVKNDIATDWMKIRKTRKATDSETAFKQLKSSLDRIQGKYNLSCSDIIKICVVNGWYGCKASYFDNIRLADYDLTTSEQQQDLFSSTNDTSQESISPWGVKYQ